MDRTTELVDRDLDLTPRPPEEPPAPPPSEQGGGGGRSWAAVALIAGLVGASLGGVTGALVATTLDDDTPAGVAAVLPQVEHPGDIREIVAAVGPSVVSIQTQSVGVGAFLEPVPQSGAGSGFIISEDGVIVTNNHVVEAADEIIVTLSDGEELTAEVLGTDPTRDLAILDVEAEGLPTAALGDSDNLRVGDSVVAIGNALALGQEPTVTSGIVSAVNRSIAASGSVTLRDLIQTDAAINPGNSGGPLVNAAGEVIGMNTAIAGGAENIGFAISISSIAPTLEQAKTGEIPRQPFLGVQTITVSDQIAARFDLGVDRGALVLEVTPGSAADEAGLIQGDVITRLNSSDIEGAEDLGDAIDDLEPDAEVELEIVRDGERQTITATLGGAGSLG
jgi:S1-C subfamily serine protease